MNPKINRLEQDIEKTRDKIGELQDRLREMEKQKTELENSEIVAQFRSVQVAPQELADFIRLYREHGGAVPGPVHPIIIDPKEDEDIEE